MQKRFAIICIYRHQFMPRAHVDSIYSCVIFTFVSFLFPYFSISILQFSLSVVSDRDESPCAISSCKNRYAIVSRFIHVYLCLFLSLSRQEILSFVYVHAWQIPISWQCLPRTCHWFALRRTTSKHQFVFYGNLHNVFYVYKRQVQVHAAPLTRRKR